VWEEDFSVCTRMVIILYMYVLYFVRTVIGMGFEYVLIYIYMLCLWRVGYGGGKNERGGRFVYC
jgi:hypothetical protein